MPGTRLFEVGCGAVQLVRNLLSRHTDALWLGVDVDERQLSKNLPEPPEPPERMRFERPAHVRLLRKGA